MSKLSKKITSSMTVTTQAGKHQEIDSDGPLVPCDVCKTLIEIKKITDEYVAQLQKCCQITVIELAMGNKEAEDYFTISWSYDEM